MNLSRTFAGGPDRLCHAWWMRSCKAELILGTWDPWRKVVESLKVDILQLWPFTSYNWLFQWDYTWYKWGFLSTYNWYNSGHNCGIWWKYWYNSGMMMDILKAEIYDILNVGIWWFSSGFLGIAGVISEWLIMMLCSRRCMYSYGHLSVITGYFSGIIHVINGVISTYNW